MANNIVTVDVTELKAAVFDELIADWRCLIMDHDKSDLQRETCGALLYANRTIELMQYLAKKRDKETENNGSE